VYAQGNPAGSVFYIQKGNAKVTVLSEQGKKPWSQFWEPAISSARDVWYWHLADERLSI
jgi:hypothetical protein